MDLKDAHEETHAAWEANAAYWDEYMGDSGNDFVNVLLWPDTERLLALQPGERVLDVACGNGLYARRMAALGAEVMACDFSAELVARARARTEHDPPPRGSVAYDVVDATDKAALLALGEGRFDAALCAMALFDMAQIAPLMNALARLLRPGGRFVFSIAHPSFNSPHATHVAEMQEVAGRSTTSYAIKVSGYLRSSIERGEAIRGQPLPQMLFHRPLHALLAPAFAAGFVLDALEEPSFPPDHPQGHPLGWGGNFSEIPPALVARLRKLS